MQIETNMVRVMDSTFGPGPRNKLIGGEYEVRCSNYEYNTVDVFTKDRTESHLFNKSDLRFLTPFKFKGNHIAIGDEVKWGDTWYEVTGFFKSDKKWKITCEFEKDDTYHWDESDILDHRTGLEQPSLSGKECKVIIDDKEYLVVIK